MSARDRDQWASDLKRENRRLRRELADKDEAIRRQAEPGLDDAVFEVLEIEPAAVPPEP